MYYWLFKNINRVYETRVKKRMILGYRDTLEGSQWWKREDIEKFQWGELSKLLEHAYKHVPYWQNALGELGLRPEDIKAYADFHQLPVLDKDTIRDNYQDLLASDHRGKTWQKSTGGSTGQPLHFEYTSDSYDWRVASSKRAYGWSGAEDGRKTAYIWGGAIGKTPALRRFKEDVHHAYLRQRYYNCFGFTRRKMAEVLRDINGFRPDFIVGYTNPLYEFAKHVKKTGTLTFKPVSILSAAEKLHEFQRKEISEAFGCPVFNTYGSREFMMIASECEKHNGLHLSMENLLVEILAKDGIPARAGQIGDIVVTDLHNYGMPFIRYRIGDLGIASDRHCDCGRGLAILEDVVGRELDILRSPDGRSIPGEYFPHLMKEFPEIRRFQVIQDNVDHLLIKIVKESEFSGNRLEVITDEINKVVGDKVKVEYEYVDDIELTATGKHRVTLCQI